MPTTIPVPDAPVNERYEVETTDRPATMTLTCIDCGNDVTFWNPTESRVEWYVRSHRCGGHGWPEAIPVDYSDDEPIPFTIPGAEVAR